MDEKIVLLTLLGMSVVTYLPRVIPLLVLSGRKLPDVIVTWLSYVPPAVLAALLLPSLILQEGRLAINGNNLFFWAALPTFAVAILTRNLFAPVLVGMGVVILGRLLL